MIPTERFTIYGLGLLFAMLAAGCEGAPPTALETAAPEATAVSRSEGATTSRTEFASPWRALVAVPCLEGDVLVAGTFSGWAARTLTPTGHFHITIFLDASNLILSSGDRVWTAAAGAHEVVTRNLPPLGEAARVVAFEGRARFVTDGDDPDLRLVSRGHVLRLPDGELQFRRVELEVRCIGPDR